jgi:hypothetical protein
MIRASRAWAYPPEDLPQVSDAGGPQMRIGYLHLRDAQVISAADPVPTKGAYVRVRIETIDAWMLGRLGPPGFQTAPTDT